MNDMPPSPPCRQHGERRRTSATPSCRALLGDVARHVEHIPGAGEGRRIGKVQHAELLGGHPHGDGNRQRVDAVYRPLATEDLAPSSRLLPAS